MKDRGFSKVSIIFLIIIISIVSVSATQQGAKVGDACRATLGKFEGEIGVVDNMWNGGFRCINLGEWSIYGGTDVWVLVNPESICYEGYYLKDDLCYLIDNEEDDCENNKLDSGEEDVDCGGGCLPCDDTCFNKKQDDDEEGIDCGGPCMQKCSFDTSINPSSSMLIANGIDSQEFILTAKSGGSPLKNEKFTVSFWFPFNSKLMEDYGKISPTTITTDESGKAQFTYYSPRAPDGTYLKNLNFELRATGKSGTKTTIKLLDPKPQIKITLSQGSMLEGNEMNYADVEIIDEDSSEWSIKVTTSIGTLIRGGGGEHKTLLDKTNTKAYKFNWNPPASAVELIDGNMEYIKDHKNDWSSYTSGLKSDAVNTLSGELTGDKIGGEIESYKSQYNTWNGNVEQMQRDVNRIRTSTSSYETFLRSISFGLEGLQAYYGTKGFMDDKLGGEDSSYLESVRDKTIDYGVDSLQAGLRYWANLVREGSLDTVRIPVQIIVEVTDDDGFTTKRSKVFQYTYHIE
ncbi:MAG: hypothetical protein KKF50_05680 [Nanoarchaeota archaeon]|nr:hypothetical protein [Nanoarchaeota archaeon]